MSPVPKILTRCALCGLLSALLAGCGGTAAPDGTPLADTATAPAQEWRASPEFVRKSLTREARDDYYLSMDRHFDDGHAAVHPRHFGGWFRAWAHAPNIVLPNTTTSYERATVKRAIDIINRALVPDHRIRLGSTSNSFSTSQMAGGNTERTTAWVRTKEGDIHIQFARGGHDTPPGWAYTDGRKGLIFIDHASDTYDHPERLVELLVHELLHGVGFRSHPHDIHESILSYRFDRDGIVDELPLIDQAMLYDMYDWGNWTGLIAETFDVAGGVQFGARWIVLEDGRPLIGPFVDGGRLGPPSGQTLQGSASWTGSLTGYDWIGHAYSRAFIRADFRTFTGSAVFDQFQTAVNGAAWRTATHHGRGYVYDLDFDRHWFRSTEADGDPDIVGAIYGTNGGVAAGTLERLDTNRWLIAGFGATRNQ